MANNVSLALVLGGAVGASVGAAFRDVSGRIKGLEAQGAKARVLQKTIGDTMRLREEWSRAHAAGSNEADRLRRRLENNLRTLRAQGVEVRNLGRAFEQMGRQARGVELKARGHQQIHDGKAGLKRVVGATAAGAALLAVPTKISGDYQAQIRQLATWSGIAGTTDEAALASQISAVARDRGANEQVLAGAVGGLIEKGMDWRESLGYAPLVSDLMDGQGMEAETIATLFMAFKEAGIRDDQMRTMIGQVAAAGDIGAFGPKEMAKYLPSLLGTIRRLGMQGPEAVRFLGASLQSQYAQTQDAAAAATNMDNLLNAVISSTSQERFAKEGFDLSRSILAAVNSGQAANPVDAFIQLTEALLRRRDPAQAARLAELKQRVRTAERGGAAEAEAMADLLQAAGLSTIVSDKSASAGLLAQIKYGKTISENAAKIKATDGEQKVAEDAARAREVSNARWASAAAASNRAFRAWGDSIRPITDRVADGLASVTNGLGALAGTFPKIISGATVAAGGLAALAAAYQTFKIGRGLLNIGRGTLMGNPNIVQKVFVTNAAGIGGADAVGDGGRRGRGGRAGRLGRVGGLLASGGRFVRGTAPLALVGAGFQAADVYANAQTRDEKARGYGGVVGGLGGTLAGAAAGAAVGSVVPVVGTAVGGLIGGYLGYMAGEAAGEAGGAALFGSGGLFPGEESTTAVRDAVREIAKAPAKTPPEITQSFSFAPNMTLNVQGDVRDPQQLVQSIMPELERQMRDYAAQTRARALFDAPNI